MDARAMVTSWELEMRARRRSRNTIAAYLTGVGQFLDWCDAHEVADGLSGAGPAREWLAGMTGAWTGATMQAKLAALRSFAAYLAAEGEISESGVHRVAWPKIDETVSPALDGAQVEAMIAACPRTFTGYRDVAILSLMYDSLLRSDELMSLRRSGDVDLRQRTVRVRRGKGGKERYSAFGAQTALRLDRYQRHRDRHRHAALDAYWLAPRGPLAAESLYSLVRRRGEAVGVKAFPHMARAGGAIEWRRRNGSISGLMTIAGWRDLKMVQRYTRAAEMDLALEEARRLHDQGGQGREGRLRCGHAPEPLVARFRRLPRRRGVPPGPGRDPGPPRGKEAP